MLRKRLLCGYHRVPIRPHQYTTYSGCTGSNLMLIFHKSRQNYSFGPAVFAVGCSQDVKRSVSLDFRDKSGLFDGEWLAFMAETPSPQIIQNWKVKCRSFEQTIPISVREGQVITRINDIDHTTYISGNGRFRLEIPTGLKMSNPISSSATLLDGRVTLILQGDLGRERPSGSFTFGIADFANVGCRTRVTYIPAEPEKEDAEEVADAATDEAEVVEDQENEEEVYELQDDVEPKGS